MGWWKKEKGEKKKETLGSKWKGGKILKSFKNCCWIEFPFSGTS